MSANATARVETLHPRPASQPAAARSPRKRKAKSTAAPLHGWQRLDEIMRRGLADARATSGLASGLHELFAIRLAEAEENLAILGRSSDDDAGPRFAQQLKRTEDLRTWVGVLAALKERASWAESFAGKAAERIGWAMRRKGAR